MLVLMMAALRSYPVPTIFFDQLDNVPHLHAATVNLVLKTVNVSAMDVKVETTRYLLNML
jgi:hypothetical protein